MTRARNKRKHKPSAKHALDDVLHSLQDLVHNELADDNTVQTHGPPAARGDPRQVVQSLKALINDDGAGVADIEEITLTPVAPETAQDDASRPQDAGEPAPAASHPMAEVTSEQLMIPGTEDMGSAAPTPAAGGEQRREEAPKRDAGPKKRHRRKVRQVEMDWDDIPILNDVAAPPPAGAPGMPATPLPSADRAHDIAVRTIAKLNIELRKRGERGLDPITINRLQQLLQEELEQQGANMDNTHDSEQR